MSRDLLILVPPFRLVLRVAAILTILAGCTVLPERRGGTPSRAFTDTRQTALGRLAAEATHESDLPAAAGDPPSALCILDCGEEAFVSRIALIDAAERSIDVQTFCWTADRVGRLLAEHLLRAADRGVRVRLLLDDLDVHGRDLNMALFGACPNVQLRLYNPFRFRFFWRIARPLEMLLCLDRLDHRMHNKTFVVDNQAAIVGGRNVAEEYFGVNPTFDFRDFDLMVFGGGAAQVSECFDAYWADARSYPVQEVAPHEIRHLRLAEERRKLTATADAVRETFPYHLPQGPDEALAYVRARTPSAVVTAATQMLFDDPRKGDIDAEQPSHIRQVLAHAPPLRQVLFVNPYFVPQGRLLSALCDAGKSGVDVRVLTNSLASTDVVAVHAHYAKRRDALLKGGVQLCELRHDAEDRARLMAPDCPHADLALHGKVIVIDSRRVFIGSMNLDPRSHRLNTEDGMLIDSPDLARQVEAKLGVELRPTNCWRLSFGSDRRRIVWSTVRGGTAATQASDPDASLWKRARCELLALLPIEEEI